MPQIARSHKVIGYTNRAQYHDDYPSTANPTSSRIICINVRSGVEIHGLRVIWDTHNGPIRGTFSGEGKTSIISLMSDEIITRVEGTTTGCWDSDRTFTSLCLYSNYMVRRFGTVKGEPFAFDAEQGLDNYQGTCMGLISFETWSLNGKILALRPTFVEYPPGEIASNVSKTILKYQCVGDGEPGSSFQQNLSSPTVMLHVGTFPDITTLHPREDTLCKLPFFTAALHGGFREATEKAISMPEDRPDVISALIEYLATGSYTYAYEADPVDKEVEVSFHLEVYAAAKKYGAEDLMEETIETFAEALKAVGDCSGVSRLRMWRQAYDVGLRADDIWDTGEHMLPFRTGIVRQVRKVLAECKAEFDIAVREVEWFGLDFISIVAGNPGDE